MKKTRFVRVYQDFQKVWSPRTPDSSYDSYGIPGISPVVRLPGQPPEPSDPNLALLSEVFGTGIILEQGAYYSASQVRTAIDGFGFSIILKSGTYTP